MKMCKTSGFADTAMATERTFFHTPTSSEFIKITKAQLTLYQTLRMYGSPCLSSVVFIKDVTLIEFYIQGNTSKICK